VLAIKHCKHRGFWFQEQKNTATTVVLGLRGVKKHVFFYGVFCSETVQKTRKHQLFDHFSALQMKVKQHAATSLCEDVSM
jgi:hypothetical protein